MKEKITGKGPTLEVSTFYANEDGGGTAVVVTIASADGSRSAEMTPDQARAFADLLTEAADET